MKKIFLLFIFFTNICLGQILAWNLNGAAGNETSSNSTTNTIVNISNLTRNNVSAPTVAPINTFSATGFPLSETKSNALLSKRGFIFTLNPKCSSVSLSTLDYKIRRSGASSPNSFAWYYSIDGLVYTQIGSDIIMNTNSNNGTNQTQINLSSISTLQNINNTTTVTFLLICWNSTSSSSNISFGRSLSTSENSISINGTSNASVWNGNVWTNSQLTSSVSAVIDSDYNTSSNGNINACSLTVNTGKTLTINSNQYANIQNDITNNGTIIVEDGGSIIQVNDNAVNTGNITYKRNTTPVTRFDYTYWSTPVSPQTLLNLSPNTLSDKFYRWDFSIPNWVNVTPSSNMSVGTGYIIRSPQTFDIVTPSIYNAIFSGVPNNGIYSVPIGSQFTLIGNPYPSAISADMILTNYPGTLYFWTHNTPITNNNYTQDDYATYTLLGGVGTGPAINTGINNNIPNGNIAAGQGFFFKNQSTASSITFNNSFRLLGNNNQFFRTSQEKDRFWLEMTNNSGAYKQVLVGYVNGATNNIDPSYDGEILEAGNVISLYTIVSNRLLTIQGREYPFNINDLVSLGYKTNIAGNFNISLSNFDGIFITQNVLEDLYEGVIHDLRQSPYIFNSSSGTFNDRFILRYTNNSLSNPDFTNTNFILYVKDDLINVKSNSIIQEVKVYNILGELLYDSKFNDNLVSFNIEANNQILFVKVKTNDIFLTKKIIK